MYAHIANQRVFIERFFLDYHYFARSYKYLCSYGFVMFYLYPILMYMSYCYISYKCCTAIQDTHIPSEMCAGKHASLMGNTHPYDTGSHWFCQANPGLLASYLKIVISLSLLHNPTRDLLRRPKPVEQGVTIYLNVN